MKSELESSKADLLEEQTVREQKIRSIEASRESMESRLSDTEDELQLAKRRADSLEKQMHASGESLQKEVRGLRMQLELAMDENRRLKEDLQGI